MTVRVHLLDAGGRLPQRELRAEAEATCARAAALLGLDAVDVVIYENRWGVIPELGCGGTSPGPHNVLVSVDPGAVFDAQWRTELGPTLAHELHHCKRYRSVPSLTSSLREAIASEGLAQLFEKDFREHPPFYATALSEEELLRVWDQAQPWLDAPAYDHAWWFYGSGELPRHAGYALGWSKVGSALADLGLDAAHAWAAPASRLVR